MSYSNVNAMLKFDNEIGTPNTPPCFLYVDEYSSWKTSFESFIQHNDPDLWKSFTEKYVHPTADGSFRKAHDREKKAFAALKMGLPREVLSCFTTRKTTYELWTAIESRFGGKEQLKESNHAEEADVVNQALMAEISDANSEVVSDPFSINCAKCLELTEELNRYREDKTILLIDLDNLKQINSVLNENEKLFSDKIEAYRTETHELKVKILNQQCAIDSYITEIALQKKEYAEAQCQILNFKRTESNIAASCLVLDEIIHSQVTDTKSKKGLGLHAMPPPSHYTPMPCKDDIKVFVPATNSSILPTSVESKTESVKSKIKIANPEKLVEPNPKKAETKIESKPEKVIVHVESVKSKGKEVMTAEDDDKVKVASFNIKSKIDKNLNSSQKAFDRQNFKTEHSNNIKINSTPAFKILKREQSSATPMTTSVPQTSHLNCTEACSSNAHTSPVFVERRVCYYCGYRGHLVRNCQILAKVKSRRKEMREMGQVSPKRNSSFSKTNNRQEKAVPLRSFHNHNTKGTQSSKSKWRKIESSTTDDLSTVSDDFQKHSKLVDVIVVDEDGRPKTIKAWVPISNSPLSSMCRIQPKLKQKIESPTLDTR